MRSWGGPCVTEQDLALLSCPGLGGGCWGDTNFCGEGLLRKMFSCDWLDAARVFRLWASRHCVVWLLQPRRGHVQEWRAHTLWHSTSQSKQWHCKVMLLMWAWSALTEIWPVIFLLVSQLPKKPGSSYESEQNAEVDYILHGAILRYLKVNKNQHRETKNNTTRL